MKGTQSTMNRLEQELTKENKSLSFKILQLKNIKQLQRTNKRLKKKLTGLKK